MHDERGAEDLLETLNDVCVMKWKTLGFASTHLSYKWNQTTVVLFNKSEKRSFFSSKEPAIRIDWIYKFISFDFFIQRADEIPQTNDKVSESYRVLWRA